MKLSRDCTIHSKRTIFLLHRKHASKSHDKEFDNIIIEAESKLKEGTLILKQIAEELRVEIDPIKYYSAYTSGVQEFIEALSFYMFQKESRLLSYNEAKNWLTFTDDGSDIQFMFPLTSTDYVLGLADLTGELMRLCINATGSGDMELPFFIVRVLRDIYSCYLSFGGFRIKELPRKVQTLRNSLHKIENVCYTITVRGSEIPNKMLVDMITSDVQHDS